MLARSLGAVLGQRDVELDVVVVDEGSQDRTPQLLASLDGRVRVLRHAAPKGLPAARNAGLALATHRWVAFCDDDDLWAPDKLASQLVACEQAGARWCAVGSVNVDIHDRITGSHRPVGGDVAVALRVGNLIPGGGSGVLVERSLVEEAGGFDEGLRAAEDYDLWVRLAQLSPLAVVDRPLLAYRVWPGTMSTDTHLQRHNHEAVLQRHGFDGVSEHEWRLADLRFRQYLARNHVRSRRRARGFREYADIASRHRLPSQFLHAVAALVAPVLSERYQAARELREVPAAYLHEASGWLSTLVALPVPRADEG